MELQDWPQSLARQLVDGNEWHRAVSLDVESKILSTKEFLTGERLLGVGIARRFFSRVDTQQFWTEDDSDEKEFLMLEQLGNALSEWRPIALIGYNIAGYDIPILSIKLKQWSDWMAEHRVAQFPRGYWGLKDAVTLCALVVVQQPVRFEVAKFDNTTAKYLSLENTIAHDRFSKLPFKKSKNAVHDDKLGKGEKIHQMWKEKDPLLKAYLEGDVHDTLLLAEELWNVGR